MSLTEYDHTRALRDNSIWLLTIVPWHLTQDKGSRVCLGILAPALALASWLHWHNYVDSGWRRRLDIVLSSLYIIIELTTLESIGVEDVGLRLIALVFFAMACLHPVGSLEGLVSHLTFRYVAWVFVMRTYVEMAPLAMTAPMHLAFACLSINPPCTVNAIHIIFMGQPISTLEKLFPISPT
jgi:hypothetical protein